MMAFDTYNQAVASVTATLSNGESGRPIAINISDGQQRLGDTFGSLQARANSGGIWSGAQMQAVLAFNVKQDGSDSATIAPTLLAMPHDTSHANGGGQLGVLAFHHTQDPISGHVSPALGGTTDGMGVVTPTLSMGAHTAAPGSNGQDAAQWAEITHQHTGRPRRLTPLECERLMGWPDQWTATGTRENGATYALSDSARYRLCGNGVGAPVAEWIGRRLVQYDAALRQESAA